MNDATNSVNMRELVGRELQPWPWLEITQDRVNQFANATNDHRFIHIDPGKAALTHSVQAGQKRHKEHDYQT